MTETRHCPACQAEIPADSLDGLCPQCLMKAGLESGASASPAEAVLAATQTSPAGSGARFVPPPVDELADRFPQLEILELLGQGGMGAVYKARQRGLDRLVAVKILPPEISRDPAFAERFTREARALARLSHPHIVAVYDFGKTGPNSRPSEGRTDRGGVTGESVSPLAANPSPLYYIVMEFVDGVNLRQAIRTKSMSAKQALAVVPQICEALQFAHDEGIVHRDIKPENILVDRRGRVKIADFGLAKMLGAEPLDVALTGTHQVMGTLRYMAPEQLEGSPDVDHRADIYSLGVVFYELLTGELPLGRFAPPSKKVQIDIRLDEVVLRALEKEPSLRYQHASEVKTEVDAIVGRDAVPLTSISASAFGGEYRSQATLFGLPLVHLAFGIDPRTGRKRVAKGIIAVGDVAKGVVALGGAAYGVIAVGGLAVGLLSLGGMSVGLLAAIGGCAIGGFVWGGCAVGAVALGGFAAGGYVFGGGGFGLHVLTSEVQDPEARRFFEPWAYEWTRWMAWMSIAFPMLWVAIFLWIRWLLKPSTRPTAKSSSDDGPQFSRKAIWGAVWAPFVFGALLPLMVVETVTSSGSAGADAPPPAGVAGWIQIVGGIFTIVGVMAPFGTTILGAIAVSEIRRSPGKLYGLPLAVGDLVLFPLLLVDSLVLAAIAALVMSILGVIMPDGPKSSAAVHLPQGLTLAIALPLIAWIDFRIARAAWRAAARSETNTAESTVAESVEPDARNAESAASLRYRVTLCLVILAIYGGSFFLPTVWQRVGGVDGERSVSFMSEKPLVGWQCFREAWNHSYPSWYANPALWIGCGFLACGGWRRATALGVAGLVLALTAHDGRSIYVHGFWWWLAAAALLPAVAAYGWRRFDFGNGRDATATETGRPAAEITGSASTYTRWVIVPMLALFACYLAVVFAVMYGRQARGDYRPLEIMRVQILGGIALGVALLLLLLIRWMRTLPGETRGVLRSRLLVTLAVFVLGGAAILAYVVSPWNQPHVEAHGITFRPQSQDYEQLSLGVRFISHQGTTAPYHDPDRCEVRLQLQEAPNLLRGSGYMLLELPGMVRTDEGRREMLDRERFLAWLGTGAGTGGDAASRKQEAEELWNFLNGWSTSVPESWESFTASARTTLRHYDAGEDLGVQSYVIGNPSIGFLYALGGLAAACLVGVGASIVAARRAPVATL